MKKNPVSVIIRILISLAVLFIYYWFKLPALNLRSPDFWQFLIVAIIVFVVVNAFSQIADAIRSLKDRASGVISTEHKKFSIKSFSKPIIGAIGAVLAIVLFTIIGSAVGAQIFNAKSYNQLITLTDGDFVKDVSEISQSQIPVVDRDTAARLGKRKLGEMSDLVSQFEIAEDYTQINYKNKPTRVTPLEYGDLIKWFNNQSNGLPAYISVDMATQETTLVRLKEGMKYSESEIFMRNIHRYLRFKYPTEIFDAVSFEIDDNGTPYWVASTVKYRIGLWSGRD
ncbi:MAG: CvpA family protein, partial [Acutalibacteraceae bacterium]